MFEIVLVHDKETKGTHRFATDDARAVASSIYLDKTVLAFSDTKITESSKIKVTVEVL